MLRCEISGVLKSIGVSVSDAYLQTVMIMKISITTMILLFVITGCNEMDKPAQEEEKHCEVHHEPLKKVHGYLPDNSIMVSPEYGYSEFHAQFGDRYPHLRHPYLSSTQYDGWNVETTIEACEECEKGYARDFATYLKIDEKDRRDQYNEFLKNEPKDRISTPTFEDDELHRQSVLPPN